MSKSSRELRRLRTERSHFEAKMNDCRSASPVRAYWLSRIAEVDRQIARVEQS